MSRPTGSSPAGTSRSSVAEVLRALTGRHPPTMLGGWSARGVSPFRILVGTILSARSRDAMTDIVAQRLFERFPDAAALARAPRREVEHILQPIGFYRMKAGYVIGTARRVEQGGVPRTLRELLELPGVGRKVANCVLVYAFGRAAIPVDTHVHRITNRLGWVGTRSPEETERALVALVPRRLWPVVNEVFVAHGKAICRPVGPKCGECPVERWCGKVGVNTRKRRRGGSRG